MTGLTRLLRPKSVAVIGGGAWCASVVREVGRMGFDGPVWPVHPSRDSIEGHAVFGSVEALPDAPDAVFIGVNRNATVAIVRDLAARGAGGAVCFASGFEEAEAELADGPALQAALIEAAGDMALLGPNCYGFVNGLDRVALWPDQHGMVPVDSGVAILCQSSNVALNLSMQRRGLPIGFLGTVGNQAQTDLAALGADLLRDPRITALGLYIEGIKDLRAFEAMAACARGLGKRIVALKTGVSEQARAGAVSHTASLTGSDAGAQALLTRLGIARVATPGGLIEALKLAHLNAVPGPVGVASLSCSGGEAALMADLGDAAGIDFPPLSEVQTTALRAALGPKVALANPLDYHTYVWGNRDGMARVFDAIMQGDAVDLGVIVLDFPRDDRCDRAQWPLVVDAVAQVAGSRGKAMAVLSSIAEGLPDAVCCDMLGRGVVPLCGMAEALEAVAALSVPLGDGALVWWRAGAAGDSTVLTETQAKAQLAEYGVPVPRRFVTQDVAELAQGAAQIGFPVVLKRSGDAHKSDTGGVALGLADAAAVQAAAQTMGGPFLIEPMVQDAVAELLIGVVFDPAHGFVLTLAAGGVMADVLQDCAVRLLPVSGADIVEMLDALRMAPVLAGWRGAAAADRTAIVDAVLAVQAWVADHCNSVEEVEINPLLCLSSGAVAVDALIKRRA